MISQGFKNYLKSISLGNLTNVDDNSIDSEESPLSAHPHFRSEKHNLSSMNEQRRELLGKLKEYSGINNQIYDVECDIDLSKSNLAKLQVTVSKETYQQQSAMWELLVTEQNFLRQIQFIVEVYISVFEKISKDFFPKINVTDIFSNLKDVYRVSLEFWKECMHPLVKELVDSNNFLQSHLLKDGFKKIGQILEPYILYCTEISKCRSYILTLEKGNELFSEYTKWAMDFEESNREMLCDHLAKPFQRLTKYKILLQAIQKYSSSAEKEDILEMIEAVDAFVTKVNEKVEEKTLSRKISQLANQIDSYDVIEPLGDDMIPIVNQFNKFDFTAPISIAGKKILRQVTHQGDVKLREGQSKTVDVKLYLLTDILMITKCKKKAFGKMKIIKPPVILDKARFQKITNNAFVCISLNEFNCISALYHFSNGDPKKIDEWMQKSDEAVRHYSNLKLSLTEIALSREYHNSIPKVKVVKSSPKLNRFKSQSNADTAGNDISVIECSFKRRSPVERKHYKKDFNVGTTLTPISPLRGRKSSQPTFSTSDIDQIRRLSKSNSFHERVTQTKDNDRHDTPDIDDTNEVFSFTSSAQDLHKYCNRNKIEGVTNDNINEIGAAFAGNDFSKLIIGNSNLCKSLNQLDK